MEKPPVIVPGVSPGAFFMLLLLRPKVNLSRRKMPKTFIFAAASSIVHFKQLHKY